MKNKFDLFVIILLAVSFFAAEVSAQDENNVIKNRMFKLQSYESNTLGITKDDNDVKFTDFIPIMLWVSEGYNSDLTDYYKRITSYVLALELKTFLDEY